MIDLPDYAMYTDQGDVVADKIVALSQAAGLNWTQTLSIMRFIADQNPDQYGELMDTAVREVIYDRCKFTTDFYV
jgi:enamine deaminase RidA (YjgF/YER057c/UK114 family)